MDQLKQAENVVRFVQQHLGRVYTLKNGDHIDDSGQIVRAGKKDDKPQA